MIDAATLPIALRTAFAIVIALVCVGGVLVIQRLVAWRPAGGLALIALSPLVPHVPLAMGLSLDDLPVLVGIAALLAGLWTERSDLRPRLSAAAGDSPLQRVLVVGSLVGVALLVAAAGVSSIANGRGPSGFVTMFLRSGGRYGLLGLIAVAAAATDRPRLRADVVARSIALLGVAEAAVGLFAFMIPLPYRLGLEATRSYSILHDQIPGRIAGTLGISPDFLGAIFVFTIPLSAGLALSESNARARVLWWTAVVAQLLTLGLTFTRASLGVVIVELVVLLLLRGRLRYLAALAIALVPVAVLTPALARLFSDVPDRFALWASGVQLMIDHPLFGVGSGQTVNAMHADPGRYMHTVFGTATNTPHNTILLAGAELGVVGFLASLIINVGVALLALRALWLSRAGRLPLMHAASAVATLGFLLQGMVNDLFTVAVVGTLGALMIGTFLSETKEPLGAHSVTPKTERARRESGPGPSRQPLPAPTAQRGGLTGSSSGAEAPAPRRAARGATRQPPARD